MRLADENGVELDAEFDLEITEHGVEIVLHSRSGRSRSGVARNTAYFSALEAIIARLAQVRAIIVDVSVDSSVAQSLPKADRVIDLPYPIVLGQHVDPHALRVQITEGQRTVASDLRAGRPGGNKHKRIRIVVGLEDADVEPADVTRLLLATDGESDGRGLGVTYREATPDPTVRPADLFTFDPALRERALAGHAAVQNGLAARVRQCGLEPRSPAPNEPDFDLAWESAVAVVAEVKTLEGGHAIQQLRLGLGQVLHYRLIMRTRYPEAMAVLAVDQEPPEPWVAVCSSVGVTLTWPPDWPGVA